MSVAPRKSLGQHFLVDENILGVIERLAELDPDDVVLEIGPGLGVLTRFLAERVAHVHAVEVDRRLEPHLAGIPRTDVHWGDALRLDVAALEPPPHKLVANLPYNIATPVVAESLALPQLELWCVMVQREVADRFFARPPTKAYGSVSVLVQLATERTGLHPVSREVFRPKPNVESALVAFTRIGPASRASGQARRRGGVRPPPQDARQLPLARRRRLARAGGCRARGDRPGRERPRRGARARRSSSRSRGARVIGAAPGEDQPRARRRAAPRRRQARARNGLPASRPRRPDQRRAGGRDDRRRVRRGHDRARARSTPSPRRTAGGSGSRSGSRSPPGSGAAAPTRPRRCGSRMRSSSSRSSRPRSPSSPPRVGADVPFFLARRAAARHRRRDAARAGRSAAGLRRAPAAAEGRAEALDRRRSTRLSTGAGERTASRSVPLALRSALAATRRPRDLAGCRRTTSRARRTQRAARARRLPRRRQRSRAGRLRRSSTGGPTPRPLRRAFRAPRAALDHGSSVVRLNRMYGTHAIEHGSSRTGRWLRERRLRITLWIAAVEGLLYLFGVLRWWPAVALAAIALLFWWYAGRSNRSDTLRQASWIFAASQLLVLCVPIAFARRQGARDRPRRAARDRRTDRALQPTSVD